MAPRLKEKYASVIREALRTEFKHENIMQVGGLKKIVVNMGVGEAASSADETEHPVSPVPRTKARATGADFLSSPRRLAVGEDADATEEQENMGGIGGKKGAFTKASSHEKG